MIDPEEIEAIAQAVEGRLHHTNTGKRRHWPRRALILVVVLLLGVAIQRGIDDHGLRNFSHSCELFLAALIEATFNRAKEL